MVPATLLPATTGASTLECMSALRTTIAGIPIPNSALAREATEFVQDVSAQLLFDHSRRVFLWASLQGEKLGLKSRSAMSYFGPADEVHELLPPAGCDVVDPGAR